MGLPGRESGGVYGAQLGLGGGGRGTPWAVSARSSVLRCSCGEERERRSPARFLSVFVPSLRFVTRVAMSNVILGM